MRSNCLVFALLIWFRRKRRWAGSRSSPRRYISIRVADDCNYPHFLYVEGKHTVSFKPFDKATGPFPSIWFKGSVRWGDEKMP